MAPSFGDNVEIARQTALGRTRLINQKVDIKLIPVQRRCSQPLLALMSKQKLHILAQLRIGLWQSGAVFLTCTAFEDPYSKKEEENIVPRVLLLPLALSLSLYFLTSSDL